MVAYNIHRHAKFLICSLLSVGLCSLDALGEPYCNEAPKITSPQTCISQAKKFKKEARECYRRGHHEGATLADSHQGIVTTGVLSGGSGQTTTHDDDSGNNSLGQGMGDRILGIIDQSSQDLNKYQARLNQYKSAMSGQYEQAIRQAQLLSANNDTSGAKRWNARAQALKNCIDAIDQAKKDVAEPQSQLAEDQKKTKEANRKFAEGEKANDGKGKNLASADKNKKPEKGEEKEGQAGAPPQLPSIPPQKEDKKQELAKCSGFHDGQEKKFEAETDDKCKELKEEWLASFEDEKDKKKAPVQVAVNATSQQASDSNNQMNVDSPVIVDDVSSASRMPNGNTLIRFK